MNQIYAFQTADEIHGCEELKVSPRLQSFLQHEADSGLRFIKGFLIASVISLPAWAIISLAVR
jgi:hypothetical protein